MGEPTVAAVVPGVTSQSNSTGEWFGAAPARVPDVCPTCARRFTYISTFLDKIERDVVGGAVSMLASISTGGGLRSARDIFGEYRPKRRVDGHAPLFGELAAGFGSAFLAGY